MSVVFLRQSTPVNWMLKMRSYSFFLLEPSYTALTYGPLAEGGQEAGVKSLRAQHFQLAQSCASLGSAFCIMGYTVVKYKGHKLMLFLY